MNEQQILQEFKDAGAILTGHFILSSGLHSNTYLQCARVLMDAKRGERLCKALADKIRAEGHAFDAIVAPAMGGVVVGYEMGRQLGVPTMFCERVDGAFQLRRGFSLEKGARVLIVEDVVTTGKSSMEAVACVKECGGEPKAVCSLIDRRGSNDTSLTLPLISLLKLDVPTFKPDALPEELKKHPGGKARQSVFEPEGIMKKAVLITGGARRVGAQTALYFAMHGYDVALHYNRSKKDAIKLQKEIASLGQRCELFSLDLTRTKDIPKLMAKVKKQFPHCVALINNASIFERETFLKTNEALFDRQMDVNLKAPFFVTQAFAKIFKRGAVVNMLDTDIVTTQGTHFAYLLAKKSLAAQTEMAAAALAPKIRVNAVCPVIVLPSNELDKKYMKRLEKTLPDKRLPSVLEVAAAVYALCENEMSGEFVFVDGGKHRL